MISSWITSLFRHDDIAERKKELLNSVVVEVECNGCMAERHDFVRIMRVIGFEPSQLAGEVARCRVIKEGNSDYRDHQLALQKVPVLHQGLQKLDDGLFVLFG